MIARAGTVRGPPRTCSFTYPGPLRHESINCFSEWFPNSVPFQEPESGEGRRFSLRGIEWEGGPPPVPIFIMFKDRVSVLMETLRSFWRTMRTPYEIVIMNDNSTYPDATAFLQKLREAGVTVHDNDRTWTTFDDLYKINADFVASYMAAHTSEYYVLTDPDCALESAPWNILFVYQAVLDGLGLEAVGASLRWDDFPETMSAPYEATMLKLQANAFEMNGRHYYYIAAPVDTTFAMYRKGHKLQRLRGKYVRMLPPLGARHLDFYLEKGKLPPDYSYYHSSARAKNVNHMQHLE